MQNRENKREEDEEDAQDDNFACFRLNDITFFYYPISLPAFITFAMLKNDNKKFTSTMRNS